MQLLPNFDQATIPIEKLRDYALNMDHPEGKHKATAFKKMLGIERHHADTLRELLKSTLSTAPARPGKISDYGDHWTTYHKIVGLNARLAVVTVAWIFKKGGGDSPQLISCYLEGEEQEKLMELFSPAQDN